MTDNRNIVIKVKYPVSGKATEKFEPKMITEWNVKRILLAAGVLVFILAALFYVINNDPQKNDSDNTAVVVADTIEKKVTPQVEIKEIEIKKPDSSKQAVTKTNLPIKPTKEATKKNKPASDITVKTAVKKQSTEKVIKDIGYSKVNHHVTRAVLTYDINNKEPVGEIARAVNVSRKKPAWIYYFTELKSMKGSKVYHEWLKNDVIVSKQELIISGDTWRTSSRKLLTVSENGKWSVRLIDEHGQLLNEKFFKVE
ncbi:MAG: DUF2914 domain-containing protein [Methylobacter sp.]|uniref:DUF2914 domain-containing protein n=1 Tax=Methylobacter sp. TaxID=2051955 RepID=UPI002731A4C5|nr:DUF2914 domain-containing protein [Methylobacter sp.]MDP1663555.1 DUF2914 domain-containing protein [Methylobacter sp.]